MPLWVQIAAMGSTGSRGRQCHRAEWQGPAEIPAPTKVNAPCISSSAIPSSDPKPMTTRSCGRCRGSSTIASAFRAMIKTFQKALEPTMEIHKWAR